MRRVDGRSCCAPEPAGITLAPTGDAEVIQEVLAFTVAVEAMDPEDGDSDCVIASTVLTVGRLSGLFMNCSVRIWTT